MGEVYQHMGRPTCIAKSAYSRGEREEDLELAAALGVRFWLLACSAQCAAGTSRNAASTDNAAALGLIP